MAKRTKRPAYTRHKGYRAAKRKGSARRKGGVPPSLWAVLVMLIASALMASTQMPALDIALGQTASQNQAQSQTQNQTQTQTQDQTQPETQTNILEQTADWLELYDDGKTSAVETAVAGETQLHFIDVGQGDATLIAQSGHYALIDAGLSSSTEDLIAYLYSLDVQTIDVLVMTHPHADHIGAMDEIIEAFDIALVLLPDFDLIDEMPSTAGFEAVMEALENSDAVVETAVVGASYAVGEGTLTVVSTGVRTDNLNNISVSTLFTAGDFSMLNTGDAEQAQEEAMLASGVALNATIFQGGHHGSSTSNTLDFLKAVDPEIIVFSCGLDNSYGHPHAVVLENVATIGADYYRTDLNGNVVITYTQEDGITVICENEAA